VDRATFLEHLRQSRLLDEEQLTGVLSRFDADVPAQSIASALTDEGLLTRFQARQVWEGKARGLVLGQYRLLEELGEGGFGRVYKAVHTMMDRLVAIKVIAPELVENSGARSWFRREVLAYTELNHPNIVMAYDANEVDDVLFLVMEYVEGPNLDGLVKQNGPLEVGQACEMLRQAGLALQHAHEKGMVHRDIKPANLLIPRGGPALVKIVDFGLARLQRSAKAGTVLLQNESSFLGTPDYVSPEQARSVHNVDIRSDLYSLGCTFYFALTGRKPFVGKTLMEVLIQHLEAEPEPMQAFRPDVPDEVCRIVRRLMAKSPERRFPTPAELVAELGSWIGDDTPRSVATGSPPVAMLRATGGPPLATAAPATNGATALVPQLAFWDGPELSRSRGPSEAAPAPEPAPPPEGLSSTQCPATAEPVAPAAPDPAPDPAAAPFRASPEFRKGWRDWLTVVGAFAQGRRVLVNEPAYRALHGALLAHCRAGGDARPAVLRRLEAVVEPWVTPATLANTDSPTLASLVNHCARIDRELFGRERGPLWPWLAAALLLAGGAVLSLYLSGAQGLPAPVEAGMDWARDLTETRPLLVLGVTVPAVVLTVIVALARLLRT
jgi:hypothetical protein